MHWSWVDTEVECSSSNICYWEELPCGIYSLCLKAPNASEQLVKQKLVGEIRKHKWTDPLLNRLVEWERTCLDPKVDPFFSNDLQLQRDQLALSSNSPKGVHKAVARMELEEHGSDIHNHIPGQLMENWVLCHLKLLFLNRRFPELRCWWHRRCSASSEGPQCTKRICDAAYCEQDLSGMDSWSCIYISILFFCAVVWFCFFRFAFAFHNLSGLSFGNLQTLVLLL